MKIYLADLRADVCEAWERAFKGVDFVTIVHGSILDLTVDAVVSPANSFCFMDGGIDLVYTRHFGPEVQQQLQSAIHDYHESELLVGQAIHAKVDDPRISCVIAAPTMRVPMILPQDTINPYLATRAAILLAFKLSEIKTIAFPGMGTGVGRVHPETCARQMRQAVIDCFYGRHWYPENQFDAQRKQQLLYGDSVRDLQRPERTPQ